MGFIPKYFYLGNYPTNRENGISDELQGVCHDENHWYFSQNRHRYRGNELSDKLAMIWKIPLAHDLDKDISDKHYRKICCGTVHVGDMDFQGGFLFVPIENMIAVFTEELIPVAIQRITRPVQDKMLPFHSIGWCAVNPNDSQLYTSDQHIDTNPAANHSTICVYAVDFNKLNEIKNRDSIRYNVKNTYSSADFTLEQFLTYSYALAPYYEDGRSSAKTPLRLQHTQGGCFDDSNLLHIVNGCHDFDYDLDGISVFNVPTKEAAAQGMLEIERVAKSNQSDDHGFRFQFNGKGDEPEGITYWDLNGEKRAAGFGGVLHAIMINNVGVLEDDFYFKHYNRHLTSYGLQEQAGEAGTAYYLNRNSQRGGEHEIHKEGCRCLPAEKNRILLGKFTSDEEALAAATRIFPKSNGCAICCPSIDSDRSRDSKQ